jgi:hypothetical protein
MLRTTANGLPALATGGQVAAACPRLTPLPWRYRCTCGGSFQVRFYVEVITPPGGRVAVLRTFLQRSTVSQAPPAVDRCWPPVPPHPWKLSRSSIACRLTPCRQSLVHHPVVAFLPQGRGRDCVDSIGPADLPQGLAASATGGFRRQAEECLKPTVPGRAPLHSKPERAPSSLRVARRRSPSVVCAALDQSPHLEDASSPLIVPRCCAVHLPFPRDSWHSRGDHGEEARLDRLVRWRRAKVWSACSRTED